MEKLNLVPWNDGSTPQVEVVTKHGPIRIVVVRKGYAFVENGLKTPLAWKGSPYNATLQVEFDEEADGWRIKDDENGYPGSARVSRPLIGPLWRKSVSRNTVDVLTLALYEAFCEWVATEEADEKFKEAELRDANNTTRNLQQEYNRLVDDLIIVKAKLDEQNVRYMRALQEAVEF